MTYRIEAYEFHITIDTLILFLESGVVSELSGSDMFLLHKTVGSFVAMTNIQSGLSILNLGFGVAQVAIAARNILSGTQAR